MTRLIDWDERETWVSPREISLEIKAGNRMILGKGLYIDFDEEEFRDVEVFSRKAAMMVVLRNLLTNAAKYSLPNEAITVRQRKTIGGLFVISIRNRGHSFDDPDEAISVLGPNTQGSNAGKIGRGDESGFGMGLYIVDQLCRQLLDVGFRFREEPKGDGISVFRAELLFSADQVRYRYEHGYRG